MSNRGIGAARAVQKKLAKIVKDLNKRDELQSILESVDDSAPELNILTDPSAVEQYEEDVLTFKRDVDASITYLSKIRGKKRDASILAEYFHSQVNECFPGVFSDEVEVPVEAEPASTRKRGRPSLAELAAESETPEAKRSNRRHSEGGTAAAAETRLSSAEKTAFKSILTKLVKMPEAELFLFPVDKKSYPEYYEVIERPMDLETVKQSLDSYSSVDQVLADMRLIWSNCKEFNAPGSDISATADTMAEAMEELVEEKLGAEYIQKKKGTKRSAVKIEIPHDTHHHSSSAAAHEVHSVPPSALKIKIKKDQVHHHPADLSLSKADMNEIVKQLEKSPYAQPFLVPVDPDEAPGYLDVVDQPMDLSTIKKNIRSHLYEGDVATFVAHVHLIKANCITYNDSESEIAKWASALDAEFEKLLKAHASSVAATTASSAGDFKTPSKGGGASSAAAGAASVSFSGTASSGRKMKVKLDAEDAAEGDEEADAEAAKTAAVSKNVKKMRKMLKDINKHELSEPFAFPINLNYAPGYLSVIKTPMDLSTVKNLILTYDDSPGKFLRDLRLIWDNCQTYNQEDSDLYRSAGILREFTDSLFNEYFPQEASAAPLWKGKKAVSAAAPAIAESTPKAKGGKKNEGPIQLQDFASLATPSGKGESSGVARSAKKSGSSGAGALPKITTVPQIEEQLAALAKDTYASNAYVREAAMNAGADLLRSSKLPFVLAPTLYEVTKFGDVYPDWNTATDVIYPVGYSCNRTLRLCVESSDSATGVMPFVPVEMKSTILGSTTAEGQFEFTVSLQNGVTISTGSTPRQAWEKVFGKEQAILASLGSKVNRCRAVFNRLCIVPDCIAFLDQIPLDGPDGANYYRQITAPMWMREIHSRLVGGTYDNEFDFAWDMRLVFRNCMQYNAPASQFYKDAYNTSLIFEQLFSAWVLNIQDRSVDDIAKGSWDDWMHLRYFDSANPEENVCTITGQRGKESDFYQCQWCEDQHVKSIVKAPPTGKAKWSCPRCAAALDLACNNMSGDPFAAQHSQKFVDVPYSTEETGGNFYVPVPEIGPGWNQARRKNKGGLKMVFLSPLGYELNSKEDIPAQDEYEAGIDKELLIARAKEFQEFLQATSSAKPAAKETKNTRHKRKSAGLGSPEVATESNSGSSSSMAAPALEDEEGRLVNGKLSNFVLPAGGRFAWYGCSNESHALDMARKGRDISHLLEKRAEITAASLGSDGFFGLSIPDIRRRIEGLDFVTNIKTYVFLDSEKIRDSMISELTAEKHKIQSLNQGEEKMRACLLNERYHYELTRLNPWYLCPTTSKTETSSSAAADSEDAMVVVPNVDVGGHKEGFVRLFPAQLTPSHCDSLLAVWDFFDSAKFILGPPAFTLLDLIKSVEQPKSALPTFGQIMFDETCTALTGMLLQELRHRADLSERDEADWQAALFTRPLNVISWPQIALDCIRKLGTPFSPSEMATLLTTGLTEDTVEQNLALCLVFEHPSLDVFFYCNGKDYVWPEDNSKKVVTNALSEILSVRDTFARFVTGNTDDEDTAFDAKTFYERIRSIFFTVASSEGVANVFRSSAKEIYNYIEGLAERYGVTISMLVSTDSERISKFSEILPAIDPTERATMVYKRFWGNYSLSNTDLYREQLLTAFSFTNYKGVSDYEKKITALQALERVLLLLRKCDPERMSTDDRILVYTTLVDVCCMTKQFSGMTRSRSAKTKAACTHYVESQTFLPQDALPPLEPVKPNGRSAAVCHFSGIAMKNSIDSLKWVAVPETFKDVPLKLEIAAAAAAAAKKAAPAAAESSAATAEAELPRFRHRPSTAASSESAEVPSCVAVQTALMRVAAAREAGRTEKKRYDEYVQSELYYLSGSPITSRSLTELDADRPLLDRAMPLGFDRNGNSYWLLNVQDVATLFPYTSSGNSAVLVEGVAAQEPCVLIREVSGWWGYHSGLGIDKLLKSFSPEIVCERVLRDVMISKLAFTRRMLYAGTLRIKSTQQEWIDRRIRAERWINQVALSSDYSIPQSLKLIEMMWGRCTEVRMYMHYAYIYRKEDDQIYKSARAEKDAAARRMKRIRETLQDDSFDHHPTKGWLRVDMLTRLRELAATSTATRIHADSSVYPIIQFNLKNSAFHQRAPAVTAVAPAVPVAAALAAAAAPPATSAVDGEEDVAPEGAAAANNETLLEDMEDLLNMEEALQQGGHVEVKPEAAAAAVSAEVQMEEGHPTHEEDEAAADADADADVAMEVEEEQQQQQQPEVKSEAAAVVPSSSLLNLAAADEDALEFVPRGQMESSAPAAGSAAAAEEGNDVIDQYLDMIYAMIGTVKPVEQLHLQTGEVLRIYPRGKDAAVFMGVSQSGISLCCSGTAPDCYGFRWRLYEGPPIDFRNHRKYNWLPLESLKKMQMLRGRFIDYDMNEERTRLRQALGAPRRGGAFPVQYNVSSHRQPTPSAIGTPGAAAGGGVDDGGRAVRRAATAANESISHTLAPNRVPSYLTPATPAPFTNQHMHPLMPGRPQAMLTVSNVIVSGRMLKLKAELFSLYYILPEKQLKWPEPEGEILAQVEAAGAAAASAVLSGAAPVKPSKNDDDDEGGDGDDGAAAGANLEKAAEKAARKAKRRLKRKFAIEKFVNNVLNAVTPQQLMDEVVIFENAIPPQYVFLYTKPVPVNNTAHTLAAVASRLYSVDRSIRYDDLKGAELQSIMCAYKLRTQFALRCFLSASCTRFMCHGGKCSGFTDNASRIPDFLDSGMPSSMGGMSSSSSKFPVQDRIVRYPGMGAGGFVGHNLLQTSQMNGAGSSSGGYRNQPIFMNKYRDDEYEFQEPAKKPEKVVIDIENIQPYIPSSLEITQSEWI